MTPIPRANDLASSADVFLDTNVILYAAGGKTQAPKKHARAVEALAGNFCLSAQVLAEFYVNATRKGPKPLSPQVAETWVQQLARKPCQMLDERIVQDGIETAQRFSLSYWDGAIIAAAKKIGAKVVLSEDLSHGEDYGGVTVINPFLETTNNP